jgi:hypothetical protein
MRRTCVTFSLRLPVLAPNTRESVALDQLVEAWRAMKGVIDVRIEWKYLPNSDTSLIAHLDAFVDINATGSKELQKLYNRLSREASKEPGRLASRTCNLTELFG